MALSTELFSCYLLLSYPRDQSASQNQILLPSPRGVVFIQLNIINALLKLFVFFFLECVNIEDEQVPIVTPNPGKFIVDSATKKPMA